MGGAPQYTLSDNTNYGELRHELKHLDKKHHRHQNLHLDHAIVASYAVTPVYDSDFLQPTPSSDFLQPDSDPAGTFLTGFVAPAPAPIPQTIYGTNPNGS